MKTELQVPSNLDFIKVVEHWLLESLGIELKHLETWPEVMQRLRLALVEAYSNAVRHAHQEEASLSVVLRLELTPKAIRLEIWDQGDGYDVEEYFPPSPEDFQEGGYGWLILTRLMDTVQYQVKAGEGWNCLYLETLHPSRLKAEQRRMASERMKGVEM